MCYIKDAQNFYLRYQWLFFLETFFSIKQSTRAITYLMLVICLIILFSIIHPIANAQTYYIEAENVHYAVIGSDTEVIDDDAGDDVGGDDEC